MLKINIKLYSRILLLFLSFHFSPTFLYLKYGKTMAPPNFFKIPSKVTKIQAAQEDKCSLSRFSELICKSPAFHMVPSICSKISLKTQWPGKFAFHVKWGN